MKKHWQRFCFGLRRWADAQSEVLSQVAWLGCDAWVTLPCEQGRAGNCKQTKKLP